MEDAQAQSADIEKRCRYLVSPVNNLLWTKDDRGAINRRRKGVLIPWPPNHEPAEISDVAGMCKMASAPRYILPPPCSRVRTQAHTHFRKHTHTHTHRYAYTLVRMQL